MDTTQLKLGESPGVTAPGGQTVGSTMKETHKTKRVRQTLVDALASFHRDDSGVAMTEYIIVLR